MARPPLTPVVLLREVRQELRLEVDAVVQQQRVPVAVHRPVVAQQAVVGAVEQALVAVRPLAVKQRVAVVAVRVVDAVEPRQQVLLHLRQTRRLKPRRLRPSEQSILQPLP